MAGHSYINRVADPAAQSALLDLAGQIKGLTTRVAQLEATALLTTTVTNGIDAKGQKVTNAGFPTTDTDLVTLAYLRAFVAAQGAF